jgi:glycosyltransferase involved in cell wall biosynthesis
MNMTTQQTAFQVFSDMRWPLKTGIGNVQTELLARTPSHISVVDLAVQGSIGSPLSPWAISSALRRQRVDDGVFWSAGFVPPAMRHLPAVVTVHDLTHLHFYSRLHKTYYNLLLRPLYRRCSAIVCVSDYTRREFLAWSGMPAAKVHVVLNGVSDAYAENQQTYALPYRYVLYPGNHRSYKNLARLIAAYARSSLPRQDIHLVMTGQADPELTAQAEALGVATQLHFLGRVADADLPKIYKGAMLVAFVSLYEGFGLPLVEAMASGVPVLTSNVSAMPEVAGDAALIVDPYSVEAITAGLDTLTQNEALRTDLVGKGQQQVARFDWDQSARTAWNIVDDVYRHG